MPRKKPPAADVAPLAVTSSGGGPVVLVPADLAPAWRGTRAPDGVDVPAGWTWGKKGGPTTDYDRALAPEGAIGTARGGVGFVTLTGGRALALEGELPTAWLPTDDGGVVVRGPDVDGDDAAALRATLPTTGWRDLTTLTVGAPGTVYLFDAAVPGATDVDAIPCDPPAISGALGVGTWAVAHASVGTTDFIRLVRADGAPRATSKKKATAKAAAKTEPTASTAKAKAKKTTTPKAPAWETRRLAPAERPKDLPPPLAKGLRSPVALADGSVIGLEGTAIGALELVHRHAGGTRTLAPRGPFTACTARATTAGAVVVFATTANGDIVEFPLSAGADAARPVYAAQRQTWDLAAPTPDRLVVAVEKAVLYLARADGGWRLLDEISVKPNLLPMLRLFDDGHWLRVGNTPRVFVFACKPDGLRLVHNSLQHEGGILVVDGRGFLYGDGRGVYELDEILNARAIYDALA
jgi:hypothetical protein